MDLPSTEVIELTVAKSSVQRLAEQIRQVAAVFELRVGIEEDQRRFNSELRVTLTGSPDQIAGFKDAFRQPSQSGG